MPQIQTPYNVDLNATPDSSLQLISLCNCQQLPTSYGYMYFLEFLSNLETLTGHVVYMTSNLASKQILHFNNIY